MQQILKTYHPFRWVVFVMTAMIFMAACNDAAVKTDEKKMEAVPATVDTPAAKMAPIDTMPPIDTSAKSRPETRKTK